MPLHLLTYNGWVPPTTYPDLREAKVISLDTETYDPELRSRGKGPGFIRGSAHIVGVAIKARWSNNETFQAYYPIRHTAATEQNVDADQLFAYLRDHLTTNVAKVGANLPYDIEGLWIDGKVKVAGPLYDIQNAEGIIDEESACVVSQEHRGFRLDRLGKKYVGEGKEEELLNQLGAVDIKKRIADLPPWAVAMYAEGDVDLSLQVFDKQMLEIERQKLGDVWQLECDILPYLMEMRYHGVRVDVEQATRVAAVLRDEHKKMLDDLAGLAGRAVDPDVKDDLLYLCDAAGVKPLYTDKGNPSFTAKWLNDQKHPAFKQVVACRKIEKMARDFVEGVVIEENINGKIHAQFHQLKRNTSEEEDGEAGTRSGRFSSTNPNLQQIPKRDNYFGPLLRSMFLPDEGGEWFSGDYASQEFRLLVHYAGLLAETGHLSEGAAKAARAMVQVYREKPETDYHQVVADMTKLPRDVAKPLNLMLVYGAGQRKVARETAWITEAQYRDITFKLPDSIQAFFGGYHDGVPYVKEMLRLTDSRGSSRGWVATGYGRKRHFELWVPKGRKNSEGYSRPEPLPHALALEMWPDEPLVRADTRKALNSVIQGTAADMGKIALRSMGRAGKLPQLMVHDEFDTTIYSPQEGRIIYEAMRDAMTLCIPVVVEGGVGATWSDAAKDAKAVKDGKPSRIKEMGIL